MSCSAWLWLMITDLPGQPCNCTSSRAAADASFIFHSLASSLTAILVHTDSYFDCLCSRVIYIFVLSMPLLVRNCLYVTEDPSMRRLTHNLDITRIPAVARMADRTAPVVKVTVTLTVTLLGQWVRRRLGARHGGQTGDNLAKTDSSPLNGTIMRQKEAYRAIFCTLKTSGFNSDRTIRQYARGLLLESPFAPSSTDCWTVRTKIRQKRPSWWP